MQIIGTGFAENDTKIALEATISDLSLFHDPAKIIVISDETVFSLHRDALKNFPVILVKGGEANKAQPEVDAVIARLLEKNIDKQWMIVGAGGGVVTDIAGYAASIFKRGIPLGLVPTTLLAMTDAALGGKNGVNVGMYKNMTGTIWRPQFVLYDLQFLTTLPAVEWANGFAEIIKHACIKDAAMFSELEQHDVNYYRENNGALAALIERNVRIKNGVVANDEKETGDRFLLNFGHSFGHAIENLCALPHGYAVSMGMIIAAKLSEKLSGFDPASAARLEKLLLRYDLPVRLPEIPPKLFSAMQNDKKRDGEDLNFVLLESIGHATVKKVSFDLLREYFTQLF